MSFSIRYACPRDIPQLYRVAEKMNSANELQYFEKCFDEVELDRRVIFIAEEGSSNNILGYGQLIWSPIYHLFRKLEIPEIQDLNVIPEARCKGIASALIDICEREVANKGYTEIGIGVGVTARFGAAQRLYIKKGYIPDGLGACYDDEPLDSASIKPIDELLAIKLTKKL